MHRMMVSAVVAAGVLLLVVGSAAAPDAIPASKVKIIDLGTLRGAGGPRPPRSTTVARSSGRAAPQAASTTARVPVGDGKDARPRRAPRQDAKPGHWDQRPRPGRRVEWPCNRPTARLPVGEREDARPRHAPRHEGEPRLWDQQPWPGRGSSGPLERPHAFLWENGKMRDLGTLLGTAHCSATAINERSQIVGDCVTAGGTQHAFLGENGRMRDLGTVPGQTDCGADAINERRQIVGVVSCWDTPRRTTRKAGFPVGERKMHGLGTLSRISTSLATLRGSTSGARSSAGPSTPWAAIRDPLLWENGKVRDLGTLPGGESSTANAVNDMGQIAGGCSTAGGGYHAALWTLPPTS